MRFKPILKIISTMLFYLGIFLMVPLIVSVFDNFRSFDTFLITIIITFSVALVLCLFLPKNEDISLKESFAIVSLTWFFYAFFGGLPYFIEGIVPSLTDAFFESMSGFTTTGSTVLVAISAQSQAILFWRSFTQFLGGMGIIVLGVAILPELGVGMYQLFKAEVPGPTKDRIFPRIRQTAFSLWVVYILFAIAEAILLRLGGLSILDAFNHAFTTMATGGFSTLDNSITGFNSAYVEIVMILFMFMAGINFTLHFHFLRGNFKSYFRSPEFLVYLTIFLLSTAFVTFNIYGEIYSSVFTSIRKASFQVISVLTTTGYASADFEVWPSFSQIVLFIFMFVGAMSGSTGGGMKVIRLMIGYKSGLRQIKKLMHPNLVSHIKIGQQLIPEEIVKTVSGFLILYIGVFVGSVLIISFLGVDFITTMSAVASCLGNIGPGFGAVGAMDNYADLPIIAKNLLSFLMLLGRLEIYTVLVLFLPIYWKE